MTARMRVEAFVNSLPAHAVCDVATDPASAMTEHYGLEVREASHVTPRGAGGLCDGVSLTGADGIVLYVRFPGRRANFTLAHELGHYLIDTHADPSLSDWIQDQDDPQRALEQACDTFAAAVLLPRELVDVVVGEGPVRARHVLDLFDSSEASRHACLIALTRKLSCEGFLSTVNTGDMRVFASSRVGDARPYGWRGDPVPSGHPLQGLVDGAERSTEAQWPYPGGGTRRYYLNAYRDAEWIYVIHAEGNLWGSSELSLEDHGREGKGYRVSVHCPDCGFRGATHQFPCPTCRGHFCPRCRHCECDRRAAREKPCSNCYVTVRAELLDGGLCPDCR